MTIKSFLCVGMFACVALATGCSSVKSKLSADSIYFGGDIITVNDVQPGVEAVAVKDGKILDVGAQAKIVSDYQGQATQVVNLAGKTLLPGFIDPHSHYFSSLTVANQVNVYAPPAGLGKDSASIVAELV
jgi:adenine deaminase